MSRTYGTVNEHRRYLTPRSAVSIKNDEFISAHFDTLQVLGGLNSSSTLDFNSYISRPLVSVIDKLQIIAKSFDRVAAIKELASSLAPKQLAFAA